MNLIRVKRKQFQGMRLLKAGAFFDNAHKVAKQMLSARCLPALVLLAALFTCNAAGALENLVYNGDFELKSEQSLPPGWVMWGSEKGRNPDNYMRDTNNPHSGGACLRIMHPADTGSYIVSDPKNAISPQKGMVYTIKFWARTDKLGPSLFHVFAYSSIKPMVDVKMDGGLSLMMPARNGKNTLIN